MLRILLLLLDSKTLIRSNKDQKQHIVHFMEF